MKLLSDLHPKWMGCLRPPEHGEGMSFDCPKCGPMHTLAVYFSDPLDGKPGATWHRAYWHREGDSFLTLTLVPSIQYPCWRSPLQSGAHMAEPRRMGSSS
jgi:hypothetical protein